MYVRRGDGVVERPVKYQEIGRLRSKGNNPFINNPEFLVSPRRFQEICPQISQIDAD
jgi:hypothetical protein